MKQSHEWYTPPRYLEVVRQLLGVIDLDPASCAEANTLVQARCFYDREMDGLMRLWPGRVYLNPPYGKYGSSSQQGRWMAKLREQFEAGITVEAVALVNAATDAKWFAPLWRYSLCFVDHRINFIDGSGGCAGRLSQRASCFVYLGTRSDSFARLFRPFGHVVCPAVSFEERENGRVRVSFSRTRRSG